MTEADVIKLLIEAPIAGLAIYAISRLGTIAIASINALKEISLVALQSINDKA